MVNNLKQLRKKHGYTQKELSEKISIPLRTIQNWENGVRNIKPDKAELLANYFGVSVAYLLGYTDEIDFFLHGKPEELDASPDTKVLTKVHYLTKQDEIDKLKRETLATIQFIESITSLLSKYEYAKKGTYSLDFKNMLNVLSDFYNELERQERNNKKKDVKKMIY